MENIIFQTTGIPGLRLGSFIILWIIPPGIAFTKSYILTYRKSDTLDRWDKIGFVVAGAILSGFVLVLLYRAKYDPLKISELPNVDILELFLIIISQCAIAIFAGLILGDLHYKMSDGKPRSFKHREDPWEYTTSEIRDNFVHIQTNKDDTISGVVARYKSGDGHRELLISPVRQIDRKTITGKELDAVFLTEESIRQIYFHDEDTEGESPDLPEGDSDFSEEEMERLRKNKQMNDDNE